MANKRSSISAGLRADATDWKRGVNEAIQATHKMKREVEATRIKGPQIDSAGTVQKIAGAVTGLNSAVELAKTGYQALKGVVEGPMEANAWIGDLNDQLAAAIGNSDDAALLLGQLRSIAAEQAMSDDQLQSLVAYSERMLSLGMTVQEVAEFMRELGNAAESSGRGVEDFEGMVSALDKIKEAGADSVKVMMALAQQTPALRDAMRNAFGSKTAEELQALKLSADELIKGIVRGFQTIETARPSFNESSLANMNGSRNRQLILDGQNMGRPDKLPERQQKSAEDLKKQTQQNAELRKAEELRRKEIEDRETIAQRTRDLRAELGESYQMEIAIAQNDVERIKALEDEKDVREAIADIQKDGVKMTEDEVKAVRALVEARRADKTAADRAKASTEIGKSEEDRNIQTLRHMGQNSRANRAEDRKKMRELREQGMSPAQARFQVERDRDMQEDEALGPGRRRIRLKKRPPNPEVPAEGKVEGKVPAGVNPGAKKAKQDGSDLFPEGAGPSKEAISLLRTIEQNTRKTAGEKQKPVNR